MDVRPYLQALLGYIESKDYAGYDPYDALNSPLLNVLSRTSKWMRIVFTQGLKRFPANVRPILGIRRAHNPKGIGLFLWGYSKLYKVEKQPEHLARIEYLLSLLDKLKSQGYSGYCWGYNFDWQTRTVYRPKYTPTVVNSAFIGHALLDTYRYTAKQRALDMAISIKDFILNDLNRKEEDGTICFSYTPIDYTTVHNTNLLGASLLIRLHKYTGDVKAKDAALSSLAYSAKYQREDGSWYYADADFCRYVDSFHTGFNLQSILYFLEEGFAEEYRSTFEKGIRFYVENFFLEDGTPKYYHNCIYPIDVHSPSQAIVFFSVLGPKYRSLTDRLIKWMLQNMYSPRGYFYFQKTKYYTNKVAYMRWSQAWTFHALTEYILANSE